MAYATAIMKNAANEFAIRIGAVCSGIVGDSNHNYGYHRAANEVSSSDYSRQLPGDKDSIDWDAADAIDMSMTTSKMILVTNRFYASWKDKNDLRLNYFREIIGTLDGRNVIYMDTQSGKQGTSDSSHLWHLHSAGLRAYVSNVHAWNSWISIAAGESWAQYCQLHPDDPMTRGAVVAPAPPPRPVPPPFLLPAGHVYGLITGPWWQHGGYYASERPAILRIQNRLQFLGVAPTYSGWADGKYERPTFNAVWEFQKRRGLKVDGLVGPQTWAALFS